MTTVKSLNEWLQDAKFQVPATAVETAIAVFQTASTVIDEYAAVKEAAKKLISDVMEETGTVAYHTAAGSATVTAPSFAITYDAKALDILMRDDADLALRLSPYRKETVRAGTLRITAKK